MYPTEEIKYWPEVFNKKEATTTMSIKLLKDDTIIGKADYATIEIDYAHGKEGAFDIPDISESDPVFLYYPGTITLKDTFLDNKYTYQDVNKVSIINNGITQHYGIFNELELLDNGDMVGKFTNG